MKITQRVHWLPRKWCKIVPLSFQDDSYEEIGGNVAKDGISKFLRGYTETIQ